MFIVNFIFPLAHFQKISVHFKSPFSLQANMKTMKGERGDVENKENARAVCAPTHILLIESTVKYGGRQTMLFEISICLKWRNIRTKL